MILTSQVAATTPSMPVSEKGSNCLSSLEVSSAKRRLRLTFWQGICTRHDLLHILPPPWIQEEDKDYIRTAFLIMKVSSANPTCTWTPAWEGIRIPHCTQTCPGENNHHHLPHHSDEDLSTWLSCMGRSGVWKLSATSWQPEFQNTWCHGQWSRQEPNQFDWDWWWKISRPVAYSWKSQLARPLDKVEIFAACCSRQTPLPVNSLSPAGFDLVKTWALR